MSTKGNNSNEGVRDAGEILSMSEKFIEKYQKPVLIGVGAVILLVVVILGIRHYYILPKEREAEALIFQAESYFGGKQWDLALNGDESGSVGFEEIISDYGSTKTGKLACAYAGICYFHKGEYQKAMDYLKKFSADDKIISPSITGLIGDCYVELGQAETGVGYFEKAASKANNNLISPVYLKKAGIAYYELQNYKKALDAFSKIKKDYPTSAEGAEIDKYIIRTESLVNK